MRKLRDANASAASNASKFSHQFVSIRFNRYTEWLMTILFGGEFCNLYKGKYIGSYTRDVFK